jgi:hypothetical protein
MILLQAMMAAPFVIAASYIVMTIAFIILFFLFNFLQPKLFPKNPKHVPIYWAFLFPLLIILIFIVKMMTYDGPWIT